MRPAIEVWRDAQDAFYRERHHQVGAAVIEADRLAVVAAIAEYLHQLDATRDESNLIGWAANRVRAEFGGKYGDR